MTRRSGPWERPDPVPSAIIGGFVGIVLFVLPQPWMWIPGFALIALGASPLGRRVVRRAPISATATLLLAAALGFLLSPRPWPWPIARMMLVALAIAVGGGGVWLQLRTGRRRVAAAPHAPALARLLARSPLAFQLVVALVCWFPLAGARELGGSGRGVFEPALLAPALVAALVAAFLWESSAQHVPAQPRAHRRRRALAPRPRSARP
jgi:hypothetical protein